MVRLPAIRLNRNKLKKAALIGSAVLAVLALLTALACWFFGIRSRQDIIGYSEMLRGRFHPIWKDLALRRIKKGDDLDELVARHEPLRREEWPPFVMLRYNEVGSFDGLAVAAKDGKLIFASVGSCCWEHTFFDTPQERETLDEAYRAWLQQSLLESAAYRIHLAVETGNDVFLAEDVERSWVTADPNDTEELLKRATATLGAEAVQKYIMAYGAEAVRPSPKLQLTVEVTEVISGDLTPGTTLTFPGEQCLEVNLDEPQTVFLHLPDSRMLFPFTQGGDIYLTVSRKALDWYHSLSAEQIEALKTRYLARRALYMKQLGQVE
ncbi:MAG: hypothetical protein JW993_01480 [Sedimentisphaerales bacterium]|nr:hypothetical protein [Sedimentisphaerales bacterium]